jgi:hypothetical protein
LSKLRFNPVELGGKTLFATGPEDYEDKEEKMRLVSPNEEAAFLNGAVSDYLGDLATQLDSTQMDVDSQNNSEESKGDKPSVPVVSPGERKKAREARMKEIEALMPRAKVPEGVDPRSEWDSYIWISQLLSVLCSQKIRGLH